MATWARLAPADFLATAASELNGTSETATYGPPYNNQSGSVQHLLITPQTWFGVTQPVNAAQDFVIRPLTTLAPADRALAAALAIYRAAPPGQQLKWANAYANAVTKVKFAGGTPVVPPAADGPVPVMMANELTMARSGALDTDLLAQRQFYGTNYTKPLLFIEDGAYFASKATALHLTGEQWGVMNETGSYPGQPWLWLYTAVVPGAGLLHLGQRGHDRGLPDRAGHHPAAAHPLHPRPARHPPAHPDPPAHLALLVPAGARPGAPHGPRLRFRQRFRLLG